MAAAATARKASSKRTSLHTRLPGTHLRWRRPAQFSLQHSRCRSRFRRCCCRSRFRRCCRFYGYRRSRRRRRGRRRPRRRRSRGWRPSRGHCESAASILLRSLLSEAVEAPLSQAQEPPAFPAGKALTGRGIRGVSSQKSASIRACQQRQDERINTSVSVRLTSVPIREHHSRQYGACQYDLRACQHEDLSRLRNRRADCTERVSTAYARANMSMSAD